VANGANIELNADKLVSGSGRGIPGCSPRAVIITHGVRGGISESARLKIRSDAPDYTGSTTAQSRSNSTRIDVGIGRRAIEVPIRNFINRGGDENDVGHCAGDARPVTVHDGH